MNWKEFLKPNIKSLALFAIFFSLTSFLVSFFISLETSYGFPLAFYQSNFSTCGGKGAAKVACYAFWDYFSLTIDIAFWFLISQFIFWKFLKK